MHGDGSILLSLILWLPLAGALIVGLLPRDEAGMARGGALAVSALVFVLSLGLLAGFDGTDPRLQFVESIPWLPKLGIGYRLGIDGLSLWLVILTTFLTPIVVISAWTAVTERVREYMAAMLVLETGMIGSLVAVDVFLFYVFWEVMLVPMFLLIGYWGGQARVYAAVKFFLFTLVGSLLMLVAVLYVYFKYAALNGGAYSTNLADLATLAVGGKLSVNEQWWLFAAFALAFAIKVPMWPLHTWLPDAHTEAPTGGSVILAGVLLKLGTYGFVRFAIPLFPLGAAAFMPAIAVLAVIGIVYGAVVALVQDDVKRLVAYSSVSHLGFVMLGLAAMSPQGVSGAMLQMLNHGISTGALFLLIGVIYERRHTRRIADFGGLTKIAPAFAAVFLVTTLSSIGLPGLNGFVGEFLILLGTFLSPGLAGAKVLAVIAATGVILSAAYMLWMFQRVMFGPVTNPENEHMSDLNAREWGYLTPLLVLMVVMGLFPNLFLKPMDASVHLFLSNYRAAVSAERAALDAPAAVRPANVVR